MALQAYHVRFKNPSGTALTWVAVVEVGGGGDGITPQLLGDIAETLVKVHANEWRYDDGRPAIQILEVRHLDRAIITLGSAAAVADRLAGGFGGGMYVKP